ncbi:MAG: oligosaccharide flippase family protein [Planctomycetota bacterium]
MSPSPDSRPPSVADRATRAAPWQIGGKVAVSLFAIVTSAVIVRGLGADTFGTYTVLQNILAFALILVMAGMTPAQSRFVPEVEETGKALRPFVRRCLSVQLVLWIPISVAAVLLDGPLTEAFELGEAGIVSFGVLLILMSVVFETLVSVLTARFAIRALVLTQVLVKTIALVAIAAALWLEGGIRSVLAIYALVHLLGSLFLWSRLPKEGAAETAIPMRRLLRFAVPVIGTMVVGQVVLRQSETLVLGLCRSNIEAGYYGAAYNLAQRFMEFVPAALWPLVLATWSAYHVRDPERLPGLIDRYWRVLLLITVPITVFGMMFFDRVFWMLYGEEMQPGALLCAGFFGVFLLTFLCQPIGMAFYVLEKPSINLRVQGLCAAVNLTLDFLLIPPLGIWGGFLAVALTFVVGDFATYWVGRRLMPGLRFPAGYLARIGLAMLPLLVFLPLRSWIENPLQLLLVAFAFGAVLLASLKLTRVVGPWEVDLLERIPLPGKVRKPLLTWFGRSV